MKNPQNKSRFQSNQWFLVGALGVGIAIFAAAAYYQRGHQEEAQPAQQAARGSDFLIRPHSPVRGPEMAEVTIVEFLDPECEACRAMFPIIKALESEYADRLRVITRYMPFHPNSLYAASMLEEAREAGKYESALETAFRYQPLWASHHAPQPELLVGYLVELGLDRKLLTPEHVIPKHRWKVDLDQADGMKLGVQKTPTFFVNGVMLNQIGYEPVKQAIEGALR